MRRAVTFPCRFQCHPSAVRRSRSEGATPGPACGAAKSRAALRTIRQTASVGLMLVRPNRRARSGDAASMPPGVLAAGSPYSRAWVGAIGGECDEAIAMPNRCRCGHASVSIWAINPGRSVECTWFHPLVYAMRWMLCRPRLIVEQGNISKRHATRAATARSPRRYPIASATCGPRMSALPARSAMVRATRRMRCIERAESCSRSIAFSNIA